MKHTDQHHNYKKAGSKILSMFLLIVILSLSCSAEMLCPITVLATMTEPDTTEEVSEETQQEKSKKKKTEETTEETANEEDETSQESSVADKTLSEILEDTETDQPAPQQEDASDEEEAAATSGTIETNEIPRWPQGPAVSAEGAILIEAETGTVLYGKNIHKRLYPASTTKILTTLIATERCDLSETVKFSKEAVNSIERSSSNMGIDIGQELTMEQCLYGILVYSANEVANAVGEHVSGSIDAFVDLMNQRATELGCLDSHFVTTNGLHNDDHYTTPYDLAQIGRAFFANETLAKISGTNYYHIPPARKQPDDIELYTHNQLTRGKYTYDGYVGGKTGYTTVAHQTLVTCAERGGLRLICVVMREDSPNQYLDTMTLFDYGFDNFKKVNVAENETRYTIRDSAFFENDALGTNQSLVAIDPDDTIVMPNTLSFDELDAFMSDAADPSDPQKIASIEYSYENKPLGSAAVVLSNTTKGFDFYDPTGNNVGHKETLYYVNIKKWIRNFAILFLVLLALTLILGSIRSYLASRHVNRQNVNFRKKEKPLRRSGSWQRRQTKVHNRISKDRAREKQRNTTYYNHQNSRNKWKRN